MTTLRREGGRIVRHTHGWYRYVAQQEDGKCEGCRDPPVPALNEDKEIVMWKPENYDKKRGGRIYKYCAQCRSYNSIKREIAKTNFLMKEDGRLVRHMQRHMLYELTKKDSDEKIRIPTEFCGLCDSADRLYRGLVFWDIQLKELGKGIERHVLLHKGFDEHDIGWYRSDWDAHINHKVLFPKRRGYRAIFKYKQFISKLWKKIRNRFSAEIPLK